MIEFLEYASGCLAVITARAEVERAKETKTTRIDRAEDGVHDAWTLNVYLEVIWLYQSEGLLDAGIGCSPRYPQQTKLALSEGPSSFCDCGIQCAFAVNPYSKRARRLGQLVIAKYHSRELFRLLWTGQSD